MNSLWKQKTFVCLDYANIETLNIYLHFLTVVKLDIFFLTKCI